MELKAFYAQTPVRRLFFIAALPGTVSMLASSLYYLIDGILVGNLLGETAFAAVNLALPLVFINFSLADLVGVGSAVPISISLGRRSEASANNAFTCAVLTIEVSGTLMGLLFYVLAPELVAMMGAEGQLAADATAYLRTYVICSPLTSIVFAMDNYLRICGRVRQSMLLNILMSVLCAGCEYVFLGVLHWGVWAAALANSVGMAVCALLALWPFLRGKMQLRFVRPRFTGALLKRIAACGSPTFLNNVAGRLIAIVSPESAPIKRMVQEARDRGVLIDATYGRRTRAVLIMDSDHIVLSALQPETVAGRLGGRDTEPAEEEKEEP